ncbi:MAG: hypothetical protein M3Y30_10660 [Gemmatimonadota bacterium]|nr:hypothetical protein [Gemmatimonadota bacterium]
MTRRTLSLFALALALGAPMALRAQDARLDARLDARTREAVVAIVDSARGDGIPTEPLVQKALEGASKHADGARILSAVQRLSRELGDARSALGTTSSDAEVIAGASALHAGIAPAALSRMRASRTHGSLTVALAVLSDLVARGVPGDTATTVISALTVAGTQDAELLRFQQGVERDIAQGATPAAALGVRAQGAFPTAAPRRTP